MRAISADLAAAQRVRSPRARVTVTVEARGQNPAAPAVAWTELIGNTGQTTFWPTAAVGLDDGNVLKFVATSAAIEQHRVTAPKTAAGWTGITPTSVHSGGAASIAAVRVPGTATVRLFYIASADGKVYYRESPDGGTTWGSAVTVYAGGDAALDLCCAYIDDGVILNGPWFIGFSTYDGMTGDYTPRFGYDNAGWITYAYAPGGLPGWRAAGIHAHGPATGSLRCLVFRQADAGPSRIREITLSGTVYGAAVDLDQTQAGLMGLQIAHARYGQLPEANATIGLVGERAHGGDTFLGVGGIFTTTDNGTAYTLADEPINLPEIEALASQTYATICSVRDGSHVDLYVVGDTVVYRGAAQAATGATLEPLRYRYHEGEFEIEFAAGIELPCVGQILVIERSIAWGSDAGSETIRAYIVRVEQRTDLVRVLAVDALAFLGLARCRRPAVLSDGSLDAASLIRRVAGRFGIPVTVDNNSLTGAAALPFTLQPNESLAGAVYRAGSLVEFYLVPNNDGTFGLTLIKPPISASGDYDDTPHVYGASTTQQPVARAGTVSDYRRLAFSYILGSYSTDPADGAYVAMAAGPVVPNTRPISYSLTNMRYNTFSRVAGAAAAEAARQSQLSVDAFIEAQANLALERYDVIEVTDSRLAWTSKRFRVRGITETYARGRLVQHLSLGAI